MIKRLFQRLFKKYGYQGWWPLFEGEELKYHPKDYSKPKKEQEFEVYIGVVLTQNTAWKNVEKALYNLKKEELLDPEKILKEKEEKIKELIRPAGYFNVKTKKLKEIARFYLENQNPTREELLSVWGIGRESADSILLYAHKKPHFVVDAYTRRIFKREGIIEGGEDYDVIKEMVEREIKDFRKLNEFHALIVREAKRLRQASKHL